MLVGITAHDADAGARRRQLLNGLARPFFGWVSDIDRAREDDVRRLRAGRVEHLGARARSGHSPIMFVLLSGAVYFTWGEIYSLFPATCTDAFGTRYATTNAGLLYTAKGTASLLVPLANVMMKRDRRLACRVRCRGLHGRRRRDPGDCRAEADARRAIDAAWPDGASLLSPGRRRTSSDPTLVAAVLRPPRSARRRT